ncbi:MAG: type II secretion system F family protein [Romboutsia sp.]
MSLYEFMVYDKNKNKLKDKELRILCKELSILLESGSEITKILDILKSQSNKRIERILVNISNHIQKGNSITESFQTTKAFSNFFLSMIKAGEVSGNLDNVMKNLSDFYDKEYKLKSKMKIILIYPLILIMISTLSMLFILLFIVPNFQIIFENNGINPPIITKILINMSIFIRKNYIVLVILILMVLLIVSYNLKNNPIIKSLNNKLKFEIPILKKFNLLVVTTRFCRSFSILIEGGVQILEALEIASNVIDNNFIYKKLLISKEYINRGNGISYSLNKSNVFPNLFISMINIGEESGKLDDSIKTINEFYENDLNIKVEQFTRSIEPIITVIIGSIIGIFIIAMVMPMFDAISSI